uniref:glutamine--tRNA ligase n=2 Tax=Eucampia antarctica TaxID=49252 RepID=A0A7S2VYJ3_9STRA|mmetsp:Transcript_1041/g.954  ORF Transcript_1041/g.954 Transcript_1041/m.954 type:complete len:634 (+) Transcript_1041:30-1931(+)
MREGVYDEGSHILRAKIDMASPNINMRDPALYRIKHESHPATGDKWCIYPMYDFSHPISDAVEGITHSLCTLEFEDHRPLYEWTVEKLLPTSLINATPRQIEFSRLNLQYTVLSKRKLIQLVQEKHVTGWDDPRMPTLSGVRRRGIPPESLRLFCERVGISKSDSNIDYGDMENCVRELLDGTSSRAFAVLKPLKVTLKNWQGSILEDFEIPRHPKILEMGNRAVPFGKRLYIERSDFFDMDGPEGITSGGKIPKGFKRLVDGGKVRLKYAYVINCDEVVRDSETNEPVELMCTLYPETRAGVTPEGMSRVKGIIQWVEASTAVKIKVNQYDRLFKVEEPGKDTGNFLDDINPDSLEVLKGVVVEPGVAIDAVGLLARIRAKSEDPLNKIYHSNLSYQFERNGYFALDSSSNGMGDLVFNRVVTLRDAWSQNTVSKKKDNGRNRGKANEQKSNNGVIEDVRRVAIRAGTILDIKAHPDAGNLIVCEVDCGDEDNKKRTVVAGLTGKVEFEDLIGKKVACVTNLKPAKMRGIESTAMLLVASDGGEGQSEQVELLSIPDAVPNGELISFEGKELSEPDTMMKSKGALKAFDRVKVCLKTNENAEGSYFQDGKEHRMMTSAGPVKTEKLKGAVIQ